MIVAEQAFNTPKEKIEELVKFLGDEIEPLWKNQSAVHNAYRCVEKSYFSYQTSDNETRVVEQIRFETIEDFERFYKAHKNGVKSFQVLKA